MDEQRLGKQLEHLGTLIYVPYEFLSMLSTPKKKYVFSLGQSTQGILESVMSWSRQKKKHMSLVMYFGTVPSSVWIDTWMSDIGGFPIKWFPIALDT